MDNNQQRKLAIKDGALRSAQTRHATREQLLKDQCYKTVLILEDDIPGLTCLFNNHRLSLKLDENLIINAISAIEDWDFTVRPISARMSASYLDLEAMSGHLAEPRRIILKAKTHLSKALTRAGELKVLLEELLALVAGRT